MNKYEMVLEEWDDRVNDKWEPADTNFLSCDQWLIDNEVYRTRIEKVESYINKAYENVDKFVTQFEPILALYWEN